MRLDSAAHLAEDVDRGVIRKIFSCPAQAEPQPGRDSRGRFTKGCKPGPGNPFNRRVAALRQSLLDRVSNDDLGAITTVTGLPLRIR